MDRAQMTDSIRFEMYRRLLDLPVHTSLTLPDLDRLLARQVVAQAVPGSGADVSHLFDLMSHDEFPLSNSRHKALRMAQHRHLEMNEREGRPDQPG